MLVVAWNRPLSAPLLHLELGLSRTEERLTKFTGSLTGCPVILGFVCKLKIGEFSQAPVAHDCNPSYSGGRDQEDQGSKPTLANSL
jgi:hypothetical protein